MKTLFQFAMGALVGLGIGALVYQQKNKTKPREDQSENPEVQETVTETTTDNPTEESSTSESNNLFESSLDDCVHPSTVIKDAPFTEEPEIKTGNARTIEQSITHYKNTNNEEMCFIMEKIQLLNNDLQLFKSKEFTDGTIAFLCWKMTYQNSTLMTTYHHQVEELGRQIKARSDRTLVFIRTNQNKDILYTISYQLSHIKQALARIDGPRRKYEKNTQNILVDEYPRILLSLIIQYQDLKHLETILPSRINTHYNANLIAKLTKGRAFDEFYQEMQRKLSYDKFKALMVEDPEQSFLNYMT